MAYRNRPPAARWIGVAAIGILGGLGNTGTVRAAEWSVEPSVIGRTFVEDNFRLRTSNEESVWGFVVEPRVQLARRTEISELRVDAGLQLRKYSDSDLDTNDQDIRFSASRRSELSQWGLEGGFVRDRTITSELDNTGFVNTNRRREEQSLSPSWTRRISERATVSLTYGYTGATYDAPVTEFVDYSYHELSGGWRYQLTPRSEVSFGATVSRFSAPDIGSNTESVVIQGGVTHRLSETLTGTLTAGARRSEADFGQTLGPFVFPQTATSTGGIATATLAGDGERSEWKVTLSRSLVPGGFGTLHQSDELEGRWMYRVNPTLNAELYVNAVSKEAIEGGSSARDRTYYRVRPALRWRLTRLLRLDFLYRYQSQKYETQGTEGDSNRFTVRLAYRWPRTSFSR